MITDEQWQTVYDAWQNESLTFSQLYERFDFLRARYSAPRAIMKAISVFASRRGLNMVSKVRPGQCPGWHTANRKRIKNPGDATQTTYVMALRDQQILWKHYLETFPNGLEENDDKYGKWGSGKFVVHRKMRTEMEAAQRKCEMVANALCERL